MSNAFQIVLINASRRKFLSTTNMHRHIMLPVEEVDISAVRYRPQPVKAPRLAGFMLKLFVWLLETPVIGPLIIYTVKQQNRFKQMLHDTVIPEKPMFKPEFPSQDPETGVGVLDQEAVPSARVQSVLEYLVPYGTTCQSTNGAQNMPLYWTIRDYAHAYRSGSVTPSIVAERVILVIEEWNKKHPSMPWLVSFSAEEVRRQSAASTQRFEEGKPLSILDGIFMPIKDDIDCLPYPTKDGTTWLHEVRAVNQDAVSVAKLRGCGVIFIGKANMHELGLGTSGSNPNYGTPRNPHSIDRYTGGSSSGPAAIVASGLCPAAIGTDGGGSVRIPSSLCGIVGLKTTYGRTDMTGSVCDCGTVEVIGPIAATVEDVLLLYSAILGPSAADRDSLKPPAPCVPSLLPNDRSHALRSLRLGKYSEWFNDVYSDDISRTCENVLNLLSDTYGCTTTEIVLPELHEMQISHSVSIGSEQLCSLNPDSRKLSQLTLDIRINVALFRTFSATDYIAAQRLRRRLMHYHMEAFKRVDVIVTPTTGVTAPVIPTDALRSGESNLKLTGELMRFAVDWTSMGGSYNYPVGFCGRGTLCKF
ncbi:fatty acid amide hydrolase isoform X2 [Nymphaea colorata]|uniref:fatty acid amide hydrolase isoform X2 n=1 Tax=Nymphaea colorata TaxID=210225 RepID=UPI00129D5C62|nr:fatty acid amide hydrolase isoform X2 [Nymphaea colorata]